MASSGLMIASNVANKLMKWTSDGLKFHRWELIVPRGGLHQTRRLLRQSIHSHKAIQLRHVLRHKAAPTQGKVSNEKSPALNSSPFMLLYSSTISYWHYLQDFELEIFKTPQNSPKR